jgi:hypothetical protein
LGSTLDAPSTHLRQQPGAGERRGKVEAELLLDVVHEIPLVGEGPVVVPGELVST